MATPKLDERNLLLSKRLENVVTDPFCFFYVDDYLPSDLYESLLASFPEDSRYTYNPEGKMGFRSSEEPEAVEQFAAAHPEWRQLVEFFGSDAFVYDARETLAEALVDARGLSGRKHWYNCTHREVPNNWLRYQLQEPVRTTYQFSLLPRDAAIAPHADAPRKLVSLLLYFRDPGWEDAWGGGTEFYVPRDPGKARRWGPTDRIPFEEFETIVTTEFRGNRLAGFVRSARSHHGVRPVACPTGTARKALLVNIKRLKWSKRHVL